MYNIYKEKGDIKIIFNSIICILFCLGIFLIPFDKLPFLNYSSYSPSSIFPFFLAFLFIMLKKFSIMKYDKWLNIFISISIGHSLISGMYYNNINSSIKHIITLVVGFSIFYTTRYAFKIKGGSKAYIRILKLSLAISLVLGYLQLLNQLGGHFHFIDKITSLFVTQVYSGRIQLVSSEPSWAIMHLLTFGVLLFAYKGKNKFLLLATVLLFFLTFSVLGYGIVLFSLVFLGLISKNKYRIKILIIVALLILSTFLVIPYIIDKLNIQGYYVQRFDYRYLFSQQFLMQDSSGFMRIISPVIGLLEFIHFPFGYGGGFYYVHFQDYIMKYFSYGLNLREVQYNFLDPVNTTARNLLVKLLCEEGLLNTIFFILFLKKIFNICKNNYTKFIFCVALMLTINFDSYAFVDFWFLLGIVASKHFKDIKEHKHKKLKIVWGKKE